MQPKIIKSRADVLSLLGGNTSQLQHILTKCNRPTLGAILLLANKRCKLPK